MRRTLFRYRSFNTDKLNDYSYIHQRIINIEKWKFEAFEGLVYQIGRASCRERVCQYV